MGVYFGKNNNHFLFCENAWLTLRLNVIFILKHGCADRKR